VPLRTPGPGSHTVAAGIDRAIGFVIDTTPLRGQAQPNGKESHGYTAASEYAGLANRALPTAAHQLQTQLANTPSTPVHNTSDLHSVRTNNIQFSVTNVIKEIFGTLRPLAESKGLLLRTDIADDFRNGFEVMGDPGHLQQLLSSLLKHSIQTTRLGFVWASVVKEQGDLESATVKFVITDTGRITETSLSGPLGTTEGSCIHHELGVCKAMVEAMNGRMSLDSIAETGTTTTILIPFSLPAGGQIMTCPDKQSST
jgi:hypothetical protein